MTINELRTKRAKAWESAKAFLDSHRNDKGVLSAEDDATYARMENGVFNDLSADLSTTLPKNIDVNAHSTVSSGVAGGANGFILQLNIQNFNNYTSEDISELTNEIMATAGAYAQRKGVVFA